MNVYRAIGTMVLILVQNIDCGYTLEPPRSSNEYPQSMFWIKNKKNRYNPAYLSFAFKSGVQHGHFRYVNFILEGESVFIIHFCLIVITSHFASGMSFDFFM